MITEDRPVFVDIDGTLTSEPVDHWGPVHHERIERIKAMLAAGEQVVIWSGGGTTYAKAFAERYGLTGAVCVGKPEICIDDNPTIRPDGRLKVIPPEEFFQ